jgi:hypothetical protein
MSMSTARLDGEPATRKRFTRRREVVMHVHGGQLVVIQSGASHGLAVQMEAERFDQVQLAAGVRGEPDQVTRVRRNLRLEQHDVEHARSIFELEGDDEG